MIIKIVKYGFLYNGVMYGWINKQLYKLPYFNEKTKKSYRLTKVKQIGNHFLISRNKVHFKSVKNRTIKIDFLFNYFEEKYCPF
jgi:hypothetical protein